MLSVRQRIVYIESYDIKRLDSGDKAVVDVRPPKKMKKRRELDALAIAKKHTSANSMTDRRALVVPDDSSSSDVFVSGERVPCQVINSRRRRETLCRCQTCIITLLMLLVLLCLSVSTGLIVTYLQLRKELDIVRNRMVTAEQQNKDIPDQVKMMTYKMTELEKSSLTLSETQIPKLQENITSIFSHLTSASSALHSLQQAVTTAPELYSLPKQMQQLSKNVADLGSSLQSTQQRQLTVVKRLDSVALDFNSLNISVLSFNDTVTSLNGWLSELQTVVNQTLALIGSQLSDSNVAHVTHNEKMQPWHVHLSSNDTVDEQELGADEARAIQSSVGMIEQTLYKLMMDFTEHVQSSRHALEELTHRVGILEWTVDTDDHGHQQQMDIVKRRLHQPVKAMA